MGYQRLRENSVSLSYGKNCCAPGAADVGLGILAAARALQLDFIPLLQERYDLVIPREHYESDLLVPLLELIRAENFRQQVTALGGYDTRDTGRILGEL